MKRLKYLLAVLLLSIALLPPSLVARAEATNLIANPAVETDNGAGQPANWQANSWGTNTSALTHAADGHTGKSLRIDVSAHTDGDAKWMHDAVTVSPNKEYTYTSFYKSTVDTEIDLQYLDASGNASYAYVQWVPASSDWQQLTATFTTPANAAKVVVMHVVAAAGTLQVDDFSLAETVVAPPPTGDNLLANPSFETANGGSPAGWTNNTWGTNTAQFTYESAGRTGSKSAKTTISQYTSGDAKWYANPVNVTAGTTYTYSDYYKSTAPSRVVLAYINAAGTYSYEEIAGAAAAADWTQYSASFTVPAGATQVSVYHLIDSVGSLTIDDASLTTGSTTPPPAPTVIPNPSLETGTTAPTGWTKSNWGTNTPTYQYVNEGRTGTKSVKVTVASHSSGDAKWMFDPISTLEGGQQYRFTTWYKSNIIPEAVAMYVMADGSEQYFGMPDPVPGANASTVWQEYTNTFRVPEGATGVSVFLFADKNGWIQTDDYSITDYQPTGFNRPLLTLTFDDGHEDNADNALPLLNQYGFKTTQCFATTFIEGQGQQVKNDILSFFNSGHEICSHSVTHPMMTTLNSTQLEYEVQHSKQFLESIVGAGNIKNFATPYGDYNATVNNAIDNYYGSHRTVDEGFNSKDNFDKYRLRVQNIFSTTTAAEVTNWIEQAKADKTWLVLVYHRIANDPGTYDSYINVFQQHLQAIQATGITVQTWQAALDELTPQL